MSGLTYQQKLVFDRLFANNEKIAQLNNDMKSRASFITAASTLIVGIITAAKFLPSTSSSDGVEFFLLALVCLCSVGIYWFAALLWKGGNMALSGTGDIDALYDQYISQDLDAAFGNALKDLGNTFEMNQEDNAARGRLLDKIVYFFIAQLALLALSISLPTITNIL